MTFSKTLMSLAVTSAFVLSAAGAQAVESNSTTGVKADSNVSTGIDTNLDSGVSIGDKVKIRGDVTTGSNRADTSVDTNVNTSAKAQSDTSASDDDTVGNSSQTSPESRGKGHKYGHDKHDKFSSR